MENKKYDKEQVADLLKRINEENERSKKAKDLIKPVCLTRKQINIVKSLNPSYSKTLQGEYNGFGYDDLGKHVFADNFSEVLKYLKKLSTEKKEVKIINKKENWSKRLSKLTDISFEKALEIAEEKEQAKYNQIDDLKARGYSKQRYQLIAKIERSNPLRRIENKEHAENILYASKRHNETSYDSLLEQGRELAETGQIERSEVKDYAREQIKKQAS